MRTLSVSPRPVEIPSDSDGVLHPELIAVAALLCVEGYDDHARGRILDRLADGVSPRDCVREGLLELRDLADVERLLRPSIDRAADRARLLADPELIGILADEPWLASLNLPPVSGGSPAAAGRNATCNACVRRIHDAVEAFELEGPGFPRAKTAAERRADMADVIAWYREHPEG